jgi:hypothetical protein
MLERAIVPAFDGRRSIATLREWRVAQNRWYGMRRGHGWSARGLENSNMTVRDPEGEFRQRARQHRLELARLRSYRSAADPRHSAGVAEDVVIPQRTTRRPSSRNEFSTEA